MTAVYNADWCAVRRGGGRVGEGEYIFITVLVHNHYNYSMNIHIK